MLEMLKLLKKKTFFSRLDVTCGGELEYSKCPVFKIEGHRRSENLSREKFLGVLSHDDNKNLVGLENFGFRIVCNVFNNECKYFIKGSKHRETDDSTTP